MSPVARPPAWTETVVVPPQFQVSTLGRALRVWKPRDGMGPSPSIMIILGLVAFAIAVAIALLANPWATIAPVMIGSILLLAGLLQRSQERDAATAVVEYESGFAALIGTRVTVWPWDALASITSDVTMTSNRRNAAVPIPTYRLTRANGETVAFTLALDDLSGLISAFKERAHSLLFPRMQTAYDAGETLTFGAVKVSREAIESGGRSLAWSAVASAVVDAGVLVVTPKAGSSTLEARVSRIPNVEQLAALTGIELSELKLCRW